MGVYYTFRIASHEVSLILSHSLDKQEVHTLTMLDSSSLSEQKVKALFREGLTELMRILQVEDLGEQIIAVDATQEECEWCCEALGEIPGAPHRLLDPANAYATAFYETIQREITSRFPALESISSADEQLLSDLKEVKQALQKRVMRVAIVGIMKAGKSTFLNALLGHNIMPNLDKRCTSRRFALRNSIDPEVGFQAKYRRLDVYVSSKLDATLSIDIDGLDWSDEDIRYYLRVLNTPDLWGDHKELTLEEALQLKERFEMIPFKSVSAREEIKSQLISHELEISKIVLTHPFYAMTPEMTERVEFWDTPGPNSKHSGDEEVFQAAVKSADAVILIHDIKQRDSEAQDKVLKAVEKHQGHKGTVLMIANKTDLRGLRYNISLEDLLKDIRQETKSFPKINMSELIHCSSKSAQFAREVTRLLRDHCSLDLKDLRNQRPELKDFIDEYKKFETRKTKKLFPDQPWLGVEESSNIKQVEKTLSSFLERKMNPAILQQCFSRLSCSLMRAQSETESRLKELDAEINKMNEMRSTQADLESHLEEIDAEIIVFNQNLDQKRSAKASLEAFKEQYLGGLYRQHSTLISEIRGKLRRRKSELLQDFNRRLVREFGGDDRVINVPKAAKGINALNMDELSHHMRISADSLLSTSIHPKLDEQRQSLAHRSQTNGGFACPKRIPRLAWTHPTQTPTSQVHNDQKLKDSGKKKRSKLGFTLGGIAGVATGIALAPATGGLSLLGLTLVAPAVATSTLIASGLGGLIGGTVIGNLFDSNTTVISVQTLRQDLRSELSKQLDKQLNSYVTQLERYLTQGRQDIRSAIQFGISALEREIECNLPHLQPKRDSFSEILVQITQSLNCVDERDLHMRRSSFTEDLTQINSTLTWMSRHLPHLISPV